MLNTSVHFEIFSSYLDFVQSTAIISLIVYIWLSCAFPKESPGKYDYDYFYSYHALIFSFIWDKFMRYCHFIVNISSDLNILYVKGFVLAQRKIIFIFVQFIVFYIYKKILFYSFSVNH